MQLIHDLDNIDIVFHIGDICYANGYLSQWDQFTAQVEPIASTVPYMVARFVTIICTYAALTLFSFWNFFIFSFCYLILCVVVYLLYSGNHERDWPNSGSFYGTMDSGGECGVLAQTMFYVPAENRDNFWY